MKVIARASDGYVLVEISENNFKTLPGIFRKEL